MNLLTLPAHINRVQSMRCTAVAFIALSWIRTKKNSNQTNKEAGMMEWLETVCWWHYLDSISLWQTSNAIDRYGFQPNKNWKQSNKMMTSDHTRRRKRQWNQSTKWNCRHHLLFYGLDRERDNLFGYCWVCGSDPIFIFKFFFLVVKHAHAHTQ